MSDTEPCNCEQALELQARVKELERELDESVPRSLHDELRRVKVAESRRADGISAAALELQARVRELESMLAHKESMLAHKESMLADKTRECEAKEKRRAELREAVVSASGHDPVARPGVFLGLLRAARAVLAEPETEPPKRTLEDVELELVDKWTRDAFWPEIVNDLQTLFDERRRLLPENRSEPQNERDELGKRIAELEADLLHQTVLRDEKIAEKTQECDLLRAKLTLLTGRTHP